MIHHEAEIRGTTGTGTGHYVVVWDGPAAEKGGAAELPAGWSAAAMLKRRIPAVTVTLVGAPPPADALAERIGSLLPSAAGFHRDRPRVRARRTGVGAVTHIPDGRPMYGSAMSTTNRTGKLPAS